jgi:poly(A) polymerase
MPLAPAEPPFEPGASPGPALEALDTAVRAARGLGGQAGTAPAAPAEWLAAAAGSLPEVRARLDRILLGEDPEAGLDVLLGAGALHALLPEVGALVGWSDGEWRHKDVWKHTKQVVHQAVPRLEVRWAALLHDVGKVRTRTISPDGEVHFFGHAEVGARMFDKLCRRLPLFRDDPVERDTVRFLILNHLRANQYEPSWTDSAVRRFAREMGERLGDLICLSQADITTKRPEKKRHGLSQIDELMARIRVLSAEDAVVPPLPGGIGDELMRAFHLAPSKLIGDIKRGLEAAIEAGEIEPHLEAAVYVEFLGAHRERFGLPLATGEGR